MVSQLAKHRAPVSPLGFSLEGLAPGKRRKPGPATNTRSPSEQVLVLRLNMIVGLNRPLSQSGMKYCPGEIRTPGHCGFERGPFTRRPGLWIGIATTGSGPTQFLPVENLMEGAWPDMSAT